MHRKRKRKQSEDGSPFVSIHPTPCPYRDPWFVVEDRAAFLGAKHLGADATQRRVPRRLAQGRNQVRAVRPGHTKKASTNVSMSTIA